MSFYWFDIAAAVVLLAYAAFSWLRGFVREFFAALGWLGGYLAATYFSPALSKIYLPYVKFALLSDGLAFLSVFAGVFLASQLIGYLVREKAGLKNLPGMVDGPLGAAMGLAKGVLFVAVILVPLNYFPSYKQELYGKSYIARWVHSLSAMAEPVLHLNMAQIPAAIKDELGNIKMPAMPEAVSPEQVGKAVQSAQSVAGKMLPSSNPPVKKVAPVVKQKPDAQTDGERANMDKFMQTLP
ncbi:MAG: CvpA family protein [Nitrospinae bacterium]|nr:CvpA family protein [Nitrospinota bacterium]